MLKPIFASEGIRIFRRKFLVSLHGTKKHFGDVDSICRQIVKGCWNGKYYQTSTGHFCEFYTRDFGWSIESLLKLGEKERARTTLNYALHHFEGQNKITTTISPNGVCFDFPYYAPDSLAYLLQSLRLLNDRMLVNKYKEFLEKEITKFQHLAMGKNDLVRKDKYFSSMKDYAQRQSSCYDNCMLAVVAREARNLKLKNNLDSFQHYKKRIKENFWNGSYFYDDITKKPYVAGDANVIPFYLKIFEERKMLKQAIQSIMQERLDRPFPLKYSTRSPEHKTISIEILAGDYERDAVWMHLGLMYLKILKKIDGKQFLFHKNQYKRLIEEQKTFLEVFNRNGKPFSTPLYYTDEGMLWAANYLTL